MLTWVALLAALPRVTGAEADPGYPLRASSVKSQIASLDTIDTYRSAGTTL